MMITVIIGDGSNQIVGVVNSSFPRIILEAMLTNAYWQLLLGVTALGIFLLDF